MWSSEDDTPVLDSVNVGFSRWAGDFSAPNISPVHVEPSCARTARIGSLSSSSSSELDKVLKERMKAEEKEEEQRRGVQPRGRTVGKRRAVFGAVRRFLSRSRSASKEPSSSGHKRSISLDYGRRAGASATAAAPPTTTVHNTTYNSEPAPQSLISSRPTESTPTGRGGCADRPRSDRLGREENFHLAMDNKLVHMAFAGFCKKTFAAENIEFVRQVREVDKLSTAEGTTTHELREKLRHVAEEFVSPESVTEVNVDGSSREEVLCSIQAALEAAGSGGSRRGGGSGESPWAWVLAVEATEALVGLARELHTVIFDGLWPRFLTSDEFTVMMNTKEMRTVGFTDLDGKLIVSPLPPQHRGGGAGAKGSSTGNKRQLSWRLASSFRAARSVAGSGGSGGGGGAGKDSAVAPTASEGAGGAENVAPSKQAAPSSTPTPSVGSVSGLTIGTGSGGGRSLDIVEAATAAAAAAATTKAAVTPTVRPPLARRHWGRATFRSASRPPRAVPSNVDRSSSVCGWRRDNQQQQQQQRVLGGFSARWVAAGRARRRDTTGGGCGGPSGRGGTGCAGSRGWIVSSPASPVSPILVGWGGGSRSSPFGSAAAEQRAVSLR